MIILCVAILAASLNASGGNVALSLKSPMSTSHLGRDSLSNFVERATFDLGFGVKLHVVAIRFQPSIHRIKRAKPVSPAENWQGVALIDGKPVFGTDWEMPKYVLKEAFVEINRQKVSLDVSCMYNPWFAKPDKKDFSAQKTEGGFLIDGSFSDGAGRYKAQWYVIEGASVRTILAIDER